MKRIGFASIQLSSAMGCPNYQPLPVSTGYERVIAHRSGENYAYVAKFDGVISDIGDGHVTLKGKDQEVTVEVGTKHGIVTGTYVPHRLICDRPKGYKFKAGEVLVYNTDFFRRDFFDRTQVQWCAGILANTVLLESSDTLEDSSTISPELSKKMTTSVTYMRAVGVNFDQSVNNLVSVGDEVDVDTILCVLEDSSIDDGGKFDGEALKALEGLASITPASKYSGKIDKIEIIYFGDKSDMSESLRKLVNRTDKELVDKAKLLNKPALTGKVTTPMRVGGVPLSLDTAIIKVFVTKEYVAGPGDKGVFGHALKTVYGSVMPEQDMTESGIPIDARFSYNGIASRTTLSPEIIGTYNMLLMKRSKEIAKIYKGK